MSMTRIIEARIIENTEIDNFLSIADIKNHARIDSSEDDTSLLALRSAVEQYVERKLNRFLCRKKIEYSFAISTGCYSIDLSNIKLINNITSVKSGDQDIEFKFIKENSSLTLLGLSSDISNIVVAIDVGMNADQIDATMRYAMLCHIAAKYNDRLGESDFAPEGISKVYDSFKGVRL